MVMTILLAIAFGLSTIFLGQSKMIKEVGNSVIAFYHGNAGSACHRSVLKELVESSNSSILFVEYFGYSSPELNPSKNKILLDTRNVVSFLNEKKFNEVVVFGESLGASVASYHSSISDVDKLFLVAPFSSIVDVAQFHYSFYPVGLMVRENYDTIDFLREFAGEVLIVHGANDKIIPVELSKKLYDSIDSENKSYFKIDGFGHNDIYSSSEVQELIGNFLKIKS